MFKDLIHYQNIIVDEHLSYDMIVNGLRHINVDSISQSGLTPYTRGGPTSISLVDVSYWIDNRYYDGFTIWYNKTDNAITSPYFLRISKKFKKTLEQYLDKAIDNMINNKLAIKDEQ